MKQLFKRVFIDSKWWVLCLFLMPDICLVAQNQTNIINEEIRKLEVNQSPEVLDILSPHIDPQKTKRNNYVTKSSLYNLNPSSVDYLLNSKPHFIEIPIDIDNKPTSLQLYKVNIHSSDFRLRTSDGRTMKSLGDKTFYRGINKRDPNSTVALSVFKDEIKVLISSEKGNYQIQKQEDGRYSGYYTHHLRTQKNYDCDTPEDPNPALDYIQQSAPNSRISGDCVEIYFECDYQSFLDNNSSLTDTENWINALFNEVAILYTNESIPIFISDILIWTNSDPYASLNSPLNILTEFAIQNQDNYNGRLAHFLSTRNIGGGIAWVNVLCNNYNSSNNSGPYAVSASLSTNIVPYPNYSWNVTVVAHEMGHNFGSSHTHACVWNGDNTQIDDCGNEYFGSGGSCYDAENPILPPNGGTIMSYCHIVSGIGINYANGFGAEPGSLIYNKYNSASCSTGTNCGGPLPPVNDDCSGAINLSLGSSCSPTTFTNENATSSGITPGFTCGNAGAIIDVWFKATIPASGDMVIETGQVSGGLTNTIMQAYSGTCGNLSTITCNNNGGAGNHAKITLTGQTPDNIIYLRVVDQGSNDSGSFTICAYDPSAPCHPKYNALLDLYNSTNGPLWTDKSGWEDGAAGSDCDVCLWYGVTCDGSGNITNINLSNNNLTGTLPSNIGDIGNNIDQLVFYLNNLTGFIPSSITSLTDLDVLDLGSNNLTGTIPTNIGNLTNLNTMYLDYNNIVGELPASISSISGLSTFWINNNNISGCFPPGYNVLCGNNTNFNNNNALPDNGNFIDFCSMDRGSDSDDDTYCSYYQDCDDTNPLVNPGTAEICDNMDNNCNGQIDENLHVDNNYIATSGSWHEGLNWSLGHVPTGCETAKIFNNSPLTTVTISPLFDINIEKLVIRNNTVLLNNGILNIVGSPDNAIEIESGGKYINSGICTITNYGGMGIDCYGDLENVDTLNIQKAITGETIKIRSNGSINVMENSVTIINN